MRLPRVMRAPAAAAVRHLVLLVFALADGFSGAPAEGAAPARIPACRFDGDSNELVREAASRAVSSFKVIGRALPFDAVVVNPQSPPSDGVLAVYVVRDASADQVDRLGCARSSSHFGTKALDALSVRGGCLVSPQRLNEIRCSAAAVSAFMGPDTQGRPSSPALLYILAHELAHIHQGRRGEFAGRVERIALDQSCDAKLRQLRDGCMPGLVRKEEEADAIAVDVLKRLLVTAAYRERTFTERGSMYWNIDRIRLAAARWEQQAQEGASAAVTLHSAFEPTEFPTPSVKVTAAARQFVCDVLNRRTGEVLYEVRPSTHPPAEQRLRRIVEALQPIAEALPETGGSRDFKVVAQLQQSVSPILAHIYRETGVYYASLHSQICAMVNLESAGRDCH